jgi:hypothetical protein
MFRRRNEDIACIRRKNLVGPAIGSVIALLDELTAFKEIEPGLIASVRDS